jgi:hypothetical protein
MMNFVRALLTAMMFFAGAFNAFAQNPKTVTIREMLQAAYDVAKNDQKAATDMFTLQRERKQDAPFFKLDLGGYVFCYGSNGILVTGQNQNIDIRTLKDDQGYLWGKDLYDEAPTEIGKIVEVRKPYRAPHGTTGVIEMKYSFQIRINANLVCGSGYYEPLARRGSIILRQQFTSAPWRWLLFVTNPIFVVYK